MRDLPAIIELIDEAAKWLRKKNTDQWARPWPNRPERDERVRAGIEAGHTWILWDEDRGIPAASVSMDPEGNPKLWDELELDERAVYVQRLVVKRDPEYIGKGIGAQLIDWAGRKARDDYGAEWIRIDVWTTNKALHEYYERHGFTFLRSRRDLDYPAGALLAKPTRDIREPAEPLFTESQQSSWLVVTHPKFRVYWTGSACSNLGIWLHSTAQILLAYRLTGSVIAVGLVGFAQFSGPFFLGPWAETLAGRDHRRRLLISSQVASLTVAAGMAVLQFAGLLNQPLLVVGALALGTAFTLTLPAMRAMAAALVPRADAEAALAAHTMSVNVGRAAGPVIGVGVVGLMGFGWAFTLGAVSFACLTAALVAARPPRARRAQSAARPRPHARVSTVLWPAAGNRRVQLLLLMVACVTMATDPVLVLGPAIVERVGGSDLWAGYIIAALGTGVVLGSLLPARAPSLRLAARHIGALGAAVIVFTVAPRLWVALLAALGAGVAALLAGATTQALVLAEAGDQRHASRVMALWVVACVASRPIASLLDGWLAGGRGAEVAGALLALPALAMWALVIPRVTRVGRAYLAAHQPTTSLARR
ncbi:MAG TPA: MFS transporter [Streptosporangiaceae bacterium]|nr:MFS transporter [Streptosporangiaceae bacterium]